MTTPLATEERRFRGSIVPSIWLHVSFWDRCQIRRREIILSPFLRREVRVSRADTVDVVTRRWRYPPFVWVTSVEFHTTAGRERQMFLPWRPRRVEGAMRSLGWPVQPYAE